jgi:copper chaperone
MASATYRVMGMTCAHCVDAVGSELGKLDGARSVLAGLVPGGASVVTVTSDGPLPVAMVAAALEEASGYQLAEA